MKQEDTDKLIEIEIIDRVMLDILEVLPEEAIEEFEALTSTLKNTGINKLDYKNINEEENDEYINQKNEYINEEIDSDNLESLDQLKSFLQVYNINLEDIIRHNREMVVTEIEAM